MALSGHIWTIGNLARRRFRPTPVPPCSQWTSTLEDPVAGSVRLTGLLSEAAGSDELLLVVHGLGGSGASDYAVKVARAALDEGISCLRLHLRGADRLGEDIPHAGLTDDLHHVMENRQLEKYRRVFVLGYSLGGHLALHLAVEAENPRIQAVAAVCAPLELSAGAALLDSAAGWPYRRYVLKSLFEIYDAYAARDPGRLPAAEVRCCRTIREFDGRVVAPRHGFADAGDYYRRASVGPRLGALKVPTLFVTTTGDPMVPSASLPPHLAGGSALLDVRWLERGGHVAFQADLDLGRRARPGLEHQVLDWLRRPAS